MCEIRGHFIYPRYKSSGQSDLSRMTTVIPGIKLKLFYQYENDSVERRRGKKCCKIFRAPPLPSSSFHRICWNAICKSALIYFHRGLPAELCRRKLSPDTVARTHRSANCEVSARIDGDAFSQSGKLNTAKRYNHCALRSGDAARRRKLVRIKLTYCVICGYTERTKLSQHDQ